MPMLFYCSCSQGLAGHTWSLLFNSPAMRADGVFVQSKAAGECSSLHLPHLPNSLLLFTVFFHHFLHSVSVVLPARPVQHPSTLSTAVLAKKMFVLSWGFSQLCLIPGRKEKMSLLRVELKHCPNTALRHNSNHKQINRTSHLFTWLQLSISLNASLDGSQKTAVN